MTERGLSELYAADPLHADELVFGRRTGLSRRGFLKGAGLSAMAAALGGWVPFHHLMPAGLIPAAFAERTEPFEIEGKDGLVLLNDRPLNAETPPHLLADLVTPVRHHFIRNNGIPPADVVAEQWRLRIVGAVNQPLTLSIDDLKREFDVVEMALQIECGGNGRASFNPAASGNQWTLGAIGNSRWRGVRLADVLTRAEVKASATYTGHLGADRHLSGDVSKQPLSRGVPIEKAMQHNVLLAFEQNGEPIHPHNGAPLRLVVPGWPGSCSQKWLTEIHLSDDVWRGAKMAPPAYSVPDYAPLPGEPISKDRFRTIESMPVKSLIATPRNGVRHTTLTGALPVAGHAWAGDRGVSRVEVSIDFGATWLPTRLDPPPNAGSWQAWRAAIHFPTVGYFEVWARAIDEAGVQQPFAVAWNPKGYLNNAMHRVAVLVA
ncbi:MAG: molybdopterin-dependent oxidoreductase [Pseudomonadota bacterium]